MHLILHHLKKIIGILFLTLGVVCTFIFFVPAKYADKAKQFIRPTPTIIAKKEEVTSAYVPLANVDDIINRARSAAHQAAEPQPLPDPISSECRARLEASMKLINALITKQNFSQHDLSIITLLPEMPEEVAEWLERITEYIVLTHKHMENRAEKNTIAHIFTHVLKVEKISDNDMRANELYQKILIDMPIFNNFVLHSLYLTRCLNVHN